MAAGLGVAGPQEPLAVVDEEANCDPAYMQLTCGVLPATPQLAAATGVPLGACIHPLAELPGMEELPVVDFGAAGVVRCKACRAYVNPFVEWLENGRMWKCNICNVINETSASYFCGLDSQGQRLDRNERAELCRGSVEIIAPVEYMVRSPQPPTFTFLLDVSYQAVETGLLSSACRAVREQIRGLPGGDRTLVSFITYSNTVQFYRIRRDRPRASMMEVPDIDDMMVPTPEDLLVNRSACIEQIEALLDALPEMHRGNKSTDVCLGSAIEAAYEIAQHVGGKFLVFLSSLPTKGKGKLKQRAAPRLLGGADEHKLMSPEETPEGLFYRQLAMEVSRQQISVDVFCASKGYCDLAAVGAISRFTSGQVFYYPQFDASVDGERLRHDVSHDLTRRTVWESVMRVRCSTGMHVENFYGSFFIRGQDLLTMPTANADTAFTIDLHHTNPLAPGSTIVLQAALLYTSSDGERRINVHTLCVPVATSQRDIFATTDSDQTASMMSKKALDVLLREGVPRARQTVHQQVVALARAWSTFRRKRGAAREQRAQLQQQSGQPATQDQADLDAEDDEDDALSQQTAVGLRENLQLLPLYCLAM